MLLNGEDAPRMKRVLQRMLATLVGVLLLWPLKLARDLPADHPRRARVLLDTLHRALRRRAATGRRLRDMPELTRSARLIIVDTIGRGLLAIVTVGLVMLFLANLAPVYVPMATAPLLIALLLVWRVPQALYQALRLAR